MAVVTRAARRVASQGEKPGPRRSFLFVDGIVLLMVAEARQEFDEGIELVFCHFLCRDVFLDPIRHFAVRQLCGAEMFRTGGVGHDATYPFARAEGPQVRRRGGFRRHFSCPIMAVGAMATGTMLL